TIYLPHGTVHSMGIPRSGVVVVGRIEELCSAGYTTTTAKMYLSSYGSDRTRPVPKEVIDQIVRVVPTAELEQKQGEDLQQTLQRLQKDHP
ncbi:hypothetical protein HY642_02605, partial [Candidatus Woesearchaeota archaeon]|nr:hypothetical protein [Candidatus Woesearchaeota archaeon]